jgi:cell division transport system ATP-binding protein
MSPPETSTPRRAPARINANGTTVVMATHEAAIVDKMQRRVIELVEGSIVRDETSGGYGTTAVIPELGPRKVRGVEAEKAKRAVEEAARETPTTQSVVTPRRATPSEAEPEASEAPATPSPAAQDDIAEAQDTQTRTPAAPASPSADDETPPWASDRATEDDVAEAEPSAAEPAAADRDPQPLTQSQPIIGLPLVTGPLPEDTQEHLSLAERLGLRAGKPRDEDKEQNVGPTQ